MKFVVGVDEVGRGCLAGPVMAAAVILPHPCLIEGIKDSKKLSPKKREELSRIIGGASTLVGYGTVDPLEIDRINILHAALKAMKLAIEALPVRPDYLLVDGNQPVPISIPQKCLVQGESKSISIAAASIMAKVKRDRLMSTLDAAYPGFSFSVHKGYGTERHLAEIRENGATDIHRRTFRGVV